MSDMERQVPDTFGGAGVVSNFRGPYSMGPPQADLAVLTPAIDRFGGRELGRVVTIGLVMVLALLRVFPRKLGQIRQRWSVLAAGAVVDGFETLGPTFVKLGRPVASSPGLFPAPLVDACRRCLDEVPPFSSDTVHRLIRDDLGRSPAQLFHSFDDRPLSAASIAQVHACVLPDGRDAVVKVQRPDIARRMNTDLRILHKLALVLARTKAGSRFNAPAIIKDLHDVTNQELNFALEAHRQATFGDRIGAFGDNRWVTAPEVYWDYCGPHMICMERMVGIPMDAFDTIRERDIDAELVLRRGCKAWLEAAVVHGPFHGDMHAGNMWLLDDGRCSFLDFGIMGDWTARGSSSSPTCRSPFCSIATTPASPEPSAGSRSSRLPWTSAMRWSGSNSAWSSTRFWTNRCPASTSENCSNRLSTLRNHSAPPHRGKWCSSPSNSSTSSATPRLWCPTI
jgi:hypothetical protein